MAATVIELVAPPRTRALAVQLRKVERQDRAPQSVLLHPKAGDALALAARSYSPR